MTRSTISINLDECPESVTVRDIEAGTVFMGMFNWGEGRNLYVKAGTNDNWSVVRLSDFGICAVLDSDICRYYKQYNLSMNFVEKDIKGYGDEF